MTLQGGGGGLNQSLGDIMSSKKRKASGKNRGTLLPNEYSRESLVSVEKVSLDSDRDPITFQNNLYSTHHYIVTSHRLDKAWDFTVEYNGERWQLPGKVFEAMARHREAIIKAAQKARGREQWEERERRRLLDSDQLLSSVDID